MAARQTHSRGSKWQAFFYGFIRRLYYSRITFTGKDHVPNKGPRLVLCLHRNGAVDGFIYRGAVSRLKYLVRAKLSRGIIGKVFFSGVEVNRRSDGGNRKDHEEMVETCVQHLQAGGPLAIFPEGTSKLGPSHLPFQSGAAHIALNFLETGEPLTVLPLGIHYESPYAFRSRVEVVIGEAIRLEPSTQEKSRGEQLRAIKLKFTSALEEVGFNVPDERTLDVAQKFAYIATLGTNHRYFSALKSMEQKLPEKAVAAWEQLETKLSGRGVLRHQGVPLFATQPGIYAICALLLAIPVLAGVLLNFLPLGVGRWAGRRFPDDTNIIALWQILAGVPLFILWLAAWLIVPSVIGYAWITPIYLAITWLSLKSCYRLKKLTVAAWNALFQSDLRNDALALHKSIITELP